MLCAWERDVTEEGEQRERATARKRQEDRRLTIRDRGLNLMLV